MVDELDGLGTPGCLHGVGHLTALMHWQAILDKRLTGIQPRVGCLRFDPLLGRASVGRTARWTMDGHISVLEAIFTE